MEFIRGIIIREKRLGQTDFWPIHTELCLMRELLSLPGSSCIFERVRHVRTQAVLIRETTLKLSLTHSLNKLAQKHERCSKKDFQQNQNSITACTFLFTRIQITPSFQALPELHFVYAAKFISVVRSFSLAELSIIKIKGKS